MSTSANVRLRHNSDPVLIVIPARGGSKGIPRKNLQAVDGVSLVGRAVLQARRFAREASLQDVRIVIDTDDAEIGAEAAYWGGDLPFMRPAELATDATTTVASTLRLLSRLEQSGWCPAHVVLLQPTSPLRTSADVMACWQKYNETRMSFVVSVSESKHPPQLAMYAAADGSLSWLGEPPPPNTRRQDLHPAVRVNGAVYVVATDALRREERFIVAGRTQGVMTGSGASIDVDSPDDLLLAQRLVQFYSSVDEGAPILRILSETDGMAVVAASDLSRSPFSIPVLSQDALLRAVERRSDPLPAGVLLRPVRGAPGPATWKESLGCAVGMLVDATVADWLPLTSIAADFFAVPVASAAAGAAFVATADSYLSDARALRATA